MTEIKHIGVLGMKWGRRKSRITSIKGRPVIVSGNNRFNRKINKNPSKEELKAELELGKQYVRNYLRLAGAAVVAGLVITKVGTIAAQAYVASRNAQRYKDLFG